MAWREDWAQNCFLKGTDRLFKVVKMSIQCFGQLIYLGFI